MVINMKVKYATIIVEDMDESIKFYTEVMGLKIDRQTQPTQNESLAIVHWIVELLRET